METYRLYAGSYTGGAPGNGVYALSFGPEGLRVEESWGPLTDPSYVQPAGDRLYAVEELEGAAFVAELPKDGPGGLRRFRAPGSGLCHISACGPYLYASGYAGGCLAGLRREDGEVCCFLRHEGSGPNALRQEASHIHSAHPSPDGKHLFVADLGTDRLYQYEIGPRGELTPHAPQPWVQVRPGQGPRHFAFHPDGGWLYLVTELDRSLLVYRYVREESRLEFVQEHSLRGEACPEHALAADVHVSPDGGFLYASVRGSDRIFCFRVLEGGGRLEPAGEFSSGGREPRSFGLSPDGKYLAAANQNSGNVAVFSIGKETGALEELAAELAIPRVSCVKWDR